jgi:hypothetical protein
VFVRDKQYYMTIHLGVYIDRHKISLSNYNENVDFSSLIKIEITVLDIFNVNLILPLFGWHKQSRLLMSKVRGERPREFMGFYAGERSVVHN